nr:hypothetical protein [Cryobacterium sp. SO1]
METAFAGPAKIRDRIGGLDPSVIAGYDPEEFVAIFKQTPAVHRFPARWPHGCRPWPAWSPRTGTVTRPPSGPRPVRTAPLQTALLQTALLQTARL